MLYITHTPNEKNLIIVNTVAVLELTFPGNAGTVVYKTIKPTYRFN